MDIKIDELWQTLPEVCSSVRTQDAVTITAESFFCFFSGVWLGYIWCQWEDWVIMQASSTLRKKSEKASHLTLSIEM